jgi:hypothetical protein
VPGPEQGNALPERGGVGHLRCGHDAI